MTKKEKDNIFLDSLKEFKEDLWKYCIYISKNYDNAHNAMSSAISMTYEKFSKDRVDDIKRYCFTVARNELFKKNRVSEELNEETLASAFQTDKQIEIKIIMEYLDKINKDEKEAIILSKIQGFSRKEIAQISNVSEETVKSRIARGMEKLKRILGVYDESR